MFIVWETIKCAYYLYGYFQETNLHEQRTGLYHACNYQFYFALDPGTFGQRSVQIMGFSHGYNTLLLTSLPT